jgi:uncharacterized protein (TIGR02271 family)
MNMNSLITSNKLNTALAVGASLLLAAGCCSSSKQAKKQPPAPITEGTGAPATAVQAEVVPAQPPAETTGANDIVVPLQKEQLMVGTAQTTDGSVRIKKEIKTETVSQPVQVRSESVTVERLAEGAAPAQPTGGTSALNTPFQEGEITVNLTKEQPVASTQMVPAGSVVIHKHVTTQTVPIERQVRREEVTADTTGNAQNVTISKEVSGSAQGGGPSAYGQSGGAGATVITDVSQFSATPDRTSLAGNKVNLTSVKVKDVAGDWLITVSAPSGTPIYCHTTQPTSGITPGQTVNLSGVVKPASSSSGLDSKSAQALQGQDIYIDMATVTPANQ